MLAGAPPASVFFNGRLWPSDELSAMAAGWLEILHSTIPATAELTALPLVNHPEAIALFFALSSFPLSVVVLPPDARAWRSTDLPRDADLLAEEGTTAREMERITDYAARAAARVCTGVHRPPGTLLPAQMDAAFRETGLDLVEGHDAPWFALSAYESLRQARYVLRVLAKPADPLR
ncbi:MAG TPA: hypothetical protein VMS64_09380 [Candidatus Methylomirabilis sp.]|nr:hypothetical protein [Candidatus Methylomirabilis sp.]